MMNKFLKKVINFDTKETEFLSLLCLDIVVLLFSVISICFALINRNIYWPFIIIGAYSLMRLVRNSIFLGMEYEKIKRKIKKSKSHD